MLLLRAMTRGTGRTGRRPGAPSPAACLALAALLAAAMLAMPARASEATPDALCHSEAGEDEPAFCVRVAHYAGDVCAVIEAAAARHRLPPAFMARLVWQESRFRATAVSPKGARGIAQFIPSTARMRGLKDPFNPAEALWRSAEYLSELRRRFGNLGLAAAAYNAGEARVAALLASGARLPGETERYVRSITGISAYEWTDRQPRTLDQPLFRDGAFADQCVRLASRHAPMLLAGEPFDEPDPDRPPWGVQLASHASQSVARRMFDDVARRFAAVLEGEEALVVRARHRGFGPRARYTVRIGRPSRAEALGLCRQLRAAGGHCIVARN